MTDVPVTLRPPCWCPSVGHPHCISSTKLYKFGWNTFPNNERMKIRTDRPKSCRGCLYINHLSYPRFLTCDSVNQQYRKKNNQSKLLLKAWSGHNKKVSKRFQYSLYYSLLQQISFFVVKINFGEKGGERLKEMQFSHFAINLRNTLTLNVTERDPGYRYVTLLDLCPEMQANEIHCSLWISITVPFSYYFIFDRIVCVLVTL